MTSIIYICKYGFEKSVYMHVFYFTCIEMLRCRSDNDKTIFYAAGQ